MPSVVCAGLCFFLLLPAFAQPAPGGNDECLLEFPELEVIVRQVPAIQISGVDPGALTAVSVPGIPIAVSGESSGIAIRHATGCGGDSTSPLPASEWKLDTPAGSTSALTNVTTDAVRWTPDVPGLYTVHFRACPAPPGQRNQSCSVIVVKGFTSTGKPRFETITLAPVERVLTINVTDGVQIPPVIVLASGPTAAGLQATNPGQFALANSYCTGTVSLVLGRPEWFTTNNWTQSRPVYELAEGRVYQANIAGADFPYNHNSNDMNAKLELDPPFRRLLSSDGAHDIGTMLPYGGLEVEWESFEFPEEFRPVVGDRMSVLGYHVVDCGHEPNASEIHPPIAVAVHRQSAIKLPATVALAMEDSAPRPVGDDIYVPGIVTDVFISLRGGETLGNVRRGLHQSRSVPDGKGQGGTVPVKVNQPVTPNVEFTFRVYLPPNPAFIARQYGLTPAFTPALYWREGPHPAGAKYGSRDLSLRLVEQQLEGPAPYLRFAVDLTPLATGDRIARQIEAAWVYPDILGKNWQLEDVSFQLNRLRVNDTLDFLSGDWKFWVNMSGSTQPWTKLIDCHGCVDSGTYTPVSGPWEPSSITPSGHFRGIMRRYPSQITRVEFGGYDEDALSSDGIAIASVPVFDVASPFTGESSNFCTGCSYSVNYTFSNTPHPGAVRQEVIDYFRRSLVHPAVARVASVRTESLLYSHSLESDRIRAEQDGEEGSAAMMAIRPDNLPQTLQSEDPARFAFELRKHILTLFGGIPTAAERTTLVRRLQQIKPAIPPAVYQKYLCDLETGRTCPLIR